MVGIWVQDGEDTGKSFLTKQMSSDLNVLPKLAWLVETMIRYMNRIILLATIDD